VADYKTPDRIEFVDDLPLTSMMKVDKRRLLELATHRRALDLLVVLDPIRAGRLAPGAEGGQGRVHHEESMRLAEPRRRGRIRVRVPGDSPGACSKDAPLLPGRYGPEQDALGVVDHRRAPRAGELPGELGRQAGGPAPG